MTVYMVASGSYSDYQIEALFSTQEKADAFVERVDPNGGNMSVQEMILDERQEDAPREVWHAYVRCYDGSVDKQYMRIEVVPPRFSEPGRWPGGDFDVKQIRKWPGSYCCTGASAVSAEHALKLAIEERQAWLREKTEHLEFSQVPA